MFSTYTSQGKYDIFIYIILYWLFGIIQYVTLEAENSQDP
jgi:hypothetical protein